VITYWDVPNAYCVHQCIFVIRLYQRTTVCKPTNTVPLNVAQTRRIDYLNGTWLYLFIYFMSNFKNHVQYKRNAKHPYAGPK